MNLLMKTVQLSTYNSLKLLILQTASFVNMVDLCAPSEAKGMKKLDKDIFATTVDVPCLRVKTELIPTLREILKKYLLKLKNFKPIRALATRAADTGNSETCCKKEIFLNPKLVVNFNDINIDGQLSKLGIYDNNLTKHSLQLTYENWTIDDILSAILPDGLETAASYSLIGHIVHLNLREHLVDYKYVIGEVLLDKIKQARTVINKVDTIDSKFRVFNMEVLAGESDFVTEVKENGICYKFDFSAVYWNPRLCTEHERLVKKVNPGNILYDVFAGVGPFSIPACKKRCEVLANDLNPESYKWLQYNAKLNKVESLITTYNKDGVDFIKEDIKKHILQHEGKKETHIVMNLPAIAITFLQSFKHLFTAEQLNHIKILPKIHIYCFVKGEGDAKIMAKEQVETQLNYSISESLDEIFFVRNVAPNKNMIRVSFQLTKCMLLGNKRKLNNSDSEESFKKKNVNSFLI